MNVCSSIISILCDSGRLWFACFDLYSDHLELVLVIMFKNMLSSVYCTDPFPSLSVKFEVGTRKIIVRVVF